MHLYCRQLLNTYLAPHRQPERACRYTYQPYTDHATRHSSKKLAEMELTSPPLPRGPGHRGSRDRSWCGEKAACHELQRTLPQLVLQVPREHSTAQALKLQLFLKHLLGQYFPACAQVETKAVTSRRECCI